MNKNKVGKPPQFIRKFLHWFCKPALIEEIEGDLNEEFNERIENKNVKYAKLLYAWQAFQFFKPYAWKWRLFPNRSNQRLAMIKNYNKVAYRNLIKHKLQSSIKIAGLAISIALCMLIMNYVNYELGYDTFHHKTDQIYRIVFYNGNFKSESIKVPANMLAPMMETIPEVAHLTEFSKRDYNVKAGDHYYKKIKTVIVDDSFSKVFSFRMENGYILKTPGHPDDILISAKLAKKMFNFEDPVGKIIELQANKLQQKRIVGVFKDVPNQSHFHFDILMSHDPDKKKKYHFSWKAHTMLNSVAYVKMTDLYSLEDVQLKINDYIEKTDGDPTMYKIIFQPLLDIHLTSNYPFELSENGDIRNIYTFSSIALLILFIAIVNYTVIVIADFTRRIREIGIRKASGALKKNIFAQFLIEALFTILIAMFIAAMLGFMLLPFFSILVEQQLEFGFKELGLIAVALPAITVIIVILVGVYPAYLFARLKISASLKGEIKKFRLGAWFKKTMLTIQFSIAFALIILLLVISKQITYIDQKELGFRKQGLIILNAPMINNKGAFKDKIKSHVDVENASYSYWIPGATINVGSMKHPTKEGKFEISFISGDEDLVATYGLELSSGRNLSNLIEADTTDPAYETKKQYEAATEKRSIILNELAVASLGIEDPLNKKLVYPVLRGTVVGTLKDFNTDKIHKPIKPVVYEYTKVGNYLVVACHPGKENEVVEFMRSVWSDFTVGGEMELFYLEDHLNNLYKQEHQFARAVFIFNFIAILLACLGVFAVSTLVTHQRQKEIGIRRVFGAKLVQIVSLFNREYVILLIIGFIMAVPPAMYFTGLWLENFAYRIQIGIPELASGGAIIFLLVLITASIQSLRSGTVNPAKVLKNE